MLALQTSGQFDDVDLNVETFRHYLNMTHAIQLFEQAQKLRLG